ncbi:MAG: hypothetical protein AAGF60_05595 [Pseudomonadota bacterium]
MALARRKAKALNIKGHNEVSGPRLLDEHRNDTRKLIARWAVCQACLWKIALGFPLLGQFDAAIVPMAASTFSCVFGFCFVTLLFTAKRYATPPGSTAAWVKRYEILVGICLIPAVAATLGYSLTRIAYFQGIAIVWSLILLLLVPHMFRARAIWRVLT